MTDDFLTDRQVQEGGALVEHIEQRVLFFRHSSAKVDLVRTWGDGANLLCTKHLVSIAAKEWNSLSERDAHEFGFFVWEGVINTEEFKRSDSTGSSRYISSVDGVLRLATDAEVFAFVKAHPNEWEGALRSDLP